MRAGINDRKAHLIERLGRFYHSDYVKHNRPEVSAVPFEQWLNRQLAIRGYVVGD